MKFEIQDKPMTFEEALQKNELSHLHEVIHFLENTPDVAIFPKKIEATAQHLATQHLKKIFLEDPKMPIKNVISSVLEHLPDTLTSNMLMNITRKMIQKWDKMAENYKKEALLSQRP